MIETLRLEDLDRKRVLVVWSGGLDSTSLLYRVMTETTAWVHTHFVDLIYGEPDAEAAARAAVAAQREWLRTNVRDWRHSKSSADVSGIRHQRPGDALLRGGAPSTLYHYACHGADAAFHHGFVPGHFVLTGRNSDVDSPVGERWERTLARFKENAIGAAYQFQPAPTFAALNPPPTRDEALAALPGELAAMLISCPVPVADAASPVGWRDCGHCWSCDPEGARERALPDAVRMSTLAMKLQDQAAAIRNRGRGDHSGSTQANR